jgi:hypothetical protein
VNKGWRKDPALMRRLCLTHRALELHPSPDSSCKIRLGKDTGGRVNKNSRSSEGCLTLKDIQRSYLNTLVTEVRSSSNPHSPGPNHRAQRCSSAAQMRQAFFGGIMRGEVL